MTDRPQIPQDVIAASSRVVYSCRRLTDVNPANVGITVMKCADCGEKVAAHAAVLIDRRKQVHRAGRRLEVVCDSCALEDGVESGAMVLAGPSADEIEEAMNP